MDENKKPGDNADPAANGDNKGNNEPKNPQAPSQPDNKGGDQDKKPDSQPDKDQKKFSKKERLEYAKKKIDEQLQGLGNDEDDEDDNRPVTFKDLKDMRRKEARETALTLAESIDDQDTREQVVDLLKNRIAPSGDADKDLELALAAVNGVKNANIAEDLRRKQDPKRYPSAPGGPGKGGQEAFKPTDEELVFMRPPYNLTENDLKIAREKVASKKTE